MLSRSSEQVSSSAVLVHWSPVAGAVMLNQCSNPSCSASFRSLDDGKLFRLELDPTLRATKSKPLEYYWLCKDCASIMTLRVGDHEDVVAVMLPPPLLAVPETVEFALADRKRGLLLQDVSSRLLKRGGNGIRSRFTNRQDIA